MYEQNFNIYTYFVRDHTYDCKTWWAIKHFSFQYFNFLTYVAALEIERWPKIQNDTYRLSLIIRLYD
jgi:hypothetical protein